MSYLALLVEILKIIFQYEKEQCERFAKWPVLEQLISLRLSSDLS